jgi:hypothetical protein
MQNVLNSPHTIKQYSFRFLADSRPVFYINKMAKCQPRNFYSSLLYTEPFYSKERDEVRNVIVGYTSKGIGASKLAEVLREDTSIRGADNDYLVTMEKMPLEHFKHLSSVLKIPLVVIVNSFCDMEDQTEHYELYYHYNQHKYSVPDRFLGGEKP